MRRWLSPELTVALIAALSGLAGVVCGGLITYATSRGLQDREIERQEQVERRAARSAAALEAHRLGRVSTEVRGIVATRLAGEFTRSDLRSPLSTQELAILLTHLGTSETASYQDAEFCLSRIGATLPHVPVGSRIDGNLVPALKVQQLCVEKGRRALASLVGAGAG